jgi:hypothetical protein
MSITHTELTQVHIDLGNINTQTKPWNNKHPPTHTYQAINNQPITQQDINRLNPQPVCTQHAWLNDTIINAGLYQYNKHSPYHSTRNHLTTYQTYKIQQNLHTDNKKETAHNKVMYQLTQINTRYTIIPFHTTNHWQLIIKHTNVTTHKHTFHQMDTQLTKQDNKQHHNTIEKQTLQKAEIYNPNTDAWTYSYVITQHNSHDCVVLMLTISYIYMHHPQPEAYNWQQHQTITNTQTQSYL